MSSEIAERIANRVTADYENPTARKYQIAVVGRAVDEELAEIRAALARYAVDLRNEPPPDALAAKVGSLLCQLEPKE